MKNNILKRIISSVLLLIMLLGFIGCSQSESTTSDAASSEDTVKITEESVIPSTDTANEIENDTDTEIINGDSTASDTIAADTDNIDTNAIDTKAPESDTPDTDPSPVIIPVSSPIDLMKDVKKDPGIRIKNISDTAFYTDFTAKLFKGCYTDSKNILISPLSILSALAMTANGADGDTLEEMKKAFGFSVDKLNEFMLSYMSSLSNGEKYKLSLANSIWFRDDESLTVNERFLKTNANYYGAGLYKASFNEKTRNDINGWIKNKTDGMIDNVIDKIPEDAVMYLVNALCFDAEWEEKYSEHRIKNGNFNCLDGNVKEVDFMSCKVSDYLSDDTTTGFVKYYAGRKYAFAALLPNEGITLSDYVASLTGEKISTLLTERKKGVEVKTKTPKFETEYSSLLNGTLADMGIKKAFDEGLADFSSLGRSENGNIFINRVIHKTYISVGESGTRAGATTVIEMATSSITMNMHYVTLDRPFVYMLIDCENNLPLFIGTLADV